MGPVSPRICWNKTSRVSSKASLKTQPQEPQAVATKAAAQSHACLHADLSGSFHVSQMATSPKRTVRNTLDPPDTRARHLPENTAPESPPGDVNITIFRHKCYLGEKIKNIRKTSLWVCTFRVWGSEASLGHQPATWRCECSKWGPRPGRRGPRAAGTNSRHTEAEAPTTAHTIAVAAKSLLLG